MAAWLFSSQHPFSWASLHGPTNPASALGRCSPIAAPSAALKIPEVRIAPWVPYVHHSRSLSGLFGYFAFSISSQWGNACMLCSFVHLRDWSSWGIPSASLRIKTAGEEDFKSRGEDAGIHAHGAPPSTWAATQVVNKWHPCEAAKSSISWEAISSGFGTSEADSRI